MILSLSLHVCRYAYILLGIIKQWDENDLTTLKSNGNFVDYKSLEA